MTPDFCCCGFGDFTAADSKKEKKDEKQSKQIVEGLAGGVCMKTANVKNKMKTQKNNREKSN